MNIRRLLVTALLISWLAPPVAYYAQVVPAEAFSSAVSSVEARDSSTANAQDSGLYSDGTRAINESRWSDAITIFTKVAREQGEHSDGALYWKAYAENKLGQSSVALNTCAELCHDHPKSRWIDECGALEIEIRAKSGQPIQPQAEQNDDLKLLALNSLMQQDELRALSEIQQMLKGDFPEKFKERTLFILAQGQSKQAQELLEQIANGHSSPALQAQAAKMFASHHGQQTGSPSPAAGHANRAVTLDVVVTDKSGNPVAGLQPQDFTLLDNKQPRSVQTFHAENSVNAKADDPVEVFLLIDGINSPFNSIANIRQQLVKYLRRNGGHLTQPTSFIFVTDVRAQVQVKPTRDGNALIAYLDDSSTGLRVFGQSGGLFGAEERWRLSLRALDLLAASMSKTPGRKLIVWIGPGWPGFTGSEWVRTQKDQGELFNYIAEVSTELRQARMTLCSVDPGGAGQFNVRNFLYRDFFKGVASAKQADVGDLFLQVLATQTGGQVLFGSNDLASSIDRCAADANAYYVLSFNLPPASHPNEYHAIEVQIGKPGLQARTRTGYYAQP
jgi:VWFA-related protein